MTQKKRIASKLFLLVLVMTLISCCFLGSTFARYTSGASGTGSLTVAKWDIDFDAAAGTDTSLDVTFEKLSPSKDAYTGTVRKHRTAVVPVATIENKGDVDALVTLEVAATPTLTLTGGAAYGTGVATGNGAPTEEECKAVFTVKWYTNTSNSAEGATAYTTSVNLTAERGVLYVYAQVTWTSDIGGLTGENADIRDTWIGEHVSAVTWTLECTAVQNSTRPATPATP